MAPILSRNPLGTEHMVTIGLTAFILQAPSCRVLAKVRPRPPKDVEDEEKLVVEVIEPITSASTTRRAARAAT